MKTLKKLSFLIVTGIVFLFLIRGFPTDNHIFAVGLATCKAVSGVVIGVVLGIGLLILVFYLPERPSWKEMFWNIIDYLILTIIVSFLISLAAGIVAVTIAAISSIC